MNSAESLIKSIQGLSASPGDLSALHGILKKAEDSLRNNWDVQLATLEELDPSIHSLGYLYLLWVYSILMVFLDVLILWITFVYCLICWSEGLTRGSVSKGKTSGVVLLMARFINRCDAGQIRLASEKCNLFVVSLCVFYVLERLWWCCCCCFDSLQLLLFVRDLKTEFWSLRILYEGWHHWCQLFVRFRSPLNVWLRCTRIVFSYVLRRSAIKLVSLFLVMISWRLTSLEIFISIAIMGESVSLLAISLFVSIDDKVKIN